MGLSKRYNPRTVEPRIQAFWQEKGIFHFDIEDNERPVYSIDTPPPTVSGHLHLGHVYSYSHTDFIARFWRMMGHNVFYPMGYDDNGLPTERLVERWEGVRATDIGRQAFIERCLAVSEEAEKDYRALWERLGLSIDWRYSYRSIDTLSRRTSQYSFLDLYKNGFAYRKEAPTIWCPECGTAIAQAELADLERQSIFYNLAFRFENGNILEIATTRPELLPACVAVFVHPDDARFKDFVGQKVQVPLFDQWVTVLEDPGADPEKGTGAVMCCTFGDNADVAWWYTHHLPLRVAIDRRGLLTDLGGDFSGLPVAEARQAIVAALTDKGLLLGQRPIQQTVRIHERCDTPVEYVVTKQWFIRVLDFKAALLEAGSKVSWHPAHMETRFREWVENLSWDWCISRQRYFGVPFPVWYCADCGAVVVADEAHLPVDPQSDSPAHPCPSCGSTQFLPENDVMDTWATSSVSPQVVGQWLSAPELYAKVYPFSLRPQAHEIIRTWAFYTIVKSYHHFGCVPWSDAAISGWGLAPEGSGKISKSRGGGPMPPMEMIQIYSADAVRYWAASTGFGKDAVINEEKIQVGAKLVTKLWNVARFSGRFFAAAPPITKKVSTAYDTTGHGDVPTSSLSPADRWILSLTQTLIQRVTELFQAYDYAAAKSEVETFFWRDLADNYLEMAKMRLYDENAESGQGARFVLHRILFTILKLFAPFLPYVTEEIYQELFADWDGAESIHCSHWPVADPAFMDAAAAAFGEVLIDIATAVRRYKSSQNLSLGAEIPRLYLSADTVEERERLLRAIPDITSITRAQDIAVVETFAPAAILILTEGRVRVAIHE